MSVASIAFIVAGVSRCRRAVTTWLSAFLFLLIPASLRAAEYTVIPLGPGASEPRVDLQLKRLQALVPLGVPVQWGLVTPGDVRGMADRLPRVPTLVRLASPGAASGLRQAGYGPMGQVGRVVSLSLPIDQLAAVANLPGVERVGLRMPHRLHLDVNTAENGAVAARQTSGLTGSGVLVGLIDSGIDWRHADFRHADGTTRIRAIWDQLDDSYASSGGEVGSAPPASQPLGTVYTADQINAELRGTGTVNSVDLVGHGTHVAGCAASNGLAPGGYIGVAPDADLLMVRAGGASSQDTTLSGDVVTSLQWIGDQATLLGQPVVVNMSFGQHFGAHDGTDMEEIAIDDFVSAPGRAVTLSAGNERAAAIHASGSARGSRALQLQVGSGTNDLLVVDCWFAGTDVVDLGFTDPNGHGYPDVNVAAGQCLETSGGANKVSLCVDTINPQNGSREVFVAVEPTTTGGTIDAGTWLFELRDEGGVNDGRYQCWSVNEQPFTADMDPSDTVAIPGTASGALTVGAASFRNTWPSQLGPDTQIDSSVLGDVAFFSSMGPTLDGRIKPDLVTGGNWVLSAWSRGDGTGSGLARVPPDPARVSADGAHVAAHGTSFCAPQVAGAAALLLQWNPELSGASLGAILRNSARADTFTGATPNPLWGFGKLDVAAAIGRAAAPCAADCDYNGLVTVDELVMAVDIALGLADGWRCQPADGDGSGTVTVDELVTGVNALLQGCNR